MYEMKYGGKLISIPVPEAQVAEILYPNKVKLPGGSAKEIVERALDAPIGAGPLGKVVHQGEKICIIISDITRSWLPSRDYLPVLIRRLNLAGIQDQDIIILSANGTHRRQTPEEHRILLGDNLYKRFQIIDHQCEETDKLTYMGMTSRGTPVWLNSIAINCDKLILTGGVVYHSMAGFGGGRKSIVPGIAGKETINMNHCNVLNPGFGNGVHLSIRCGCMDESNPMHADLMEAAAFAKPDYLLNLVVGENHNILQAFAGDWVKAHKAATELVDTMDGVNVKGPCQLVIASAGGSPKDINLYQASKTLSNGLRMTKPGGTLIMIAECSEGIGDPDCERQICYYDNPEDRERDLRINFTIGGFIGFQFADAAEHNTLIIVSEIPKERFVNCKIIPAKTLDEALNIAAEKNGSSIAGIDTALMPQGAGTLPKFK